MVALFELYCLRKVDRLCQQECEDLGERLGTKWNNGTCRVGGNLQNRLVYTSGISSRQVRSTGIGEHKVVSEMRTSLALGAFYIELHVVRASVLQISVMNVKSHCDLRMIPKR